MSGIAYRWKRFAKRRLAHRQPSAGLTFYRSERSEEKHSVVLPAGSGTETAVGYWRAMVKAA
ncbi:hypothetical protein GCM10007159_37060 [Modicisalibacter luteus]|nr:hypothetical protein GCM10007159_37060 [Halomonas lutea]